MSRLYNDHLTGEARELAIQEAYFDNQFKKLNTMYEMICLKESQMISDAEYKVFSESGTYDDYEYLLEEVANETNDQKKGILVKMAEAVSKLFSSIINAIKNFFSKNEEAEVEIDEGEYKAMENLKTGWQKVQSGFSKILSGDIAGGWNEIPGIVKALPIIGAGTVATGVIVKKNSKEIEGKVNDITSMVSSTFEKVKSALIEKFGDNPLANTIINTVKGWASKISSFVTSLTGKISHKVSEVKDKVNTNIQNAKENKANEKNIEYQKQAAANGVRIVPNGKSEYRIDMSTGKVTLFDKKTKQESDIDASNGNLPKSVLDAIKKAKSRSAVANQAQQNTQAPHKENPDGRVVTVGNGIGANKLTVKLNEKNGMLYTVDANGKPKKTNLNEIFQMTGGRGKYKAIKSAYDAAMAEINSTESDGSVINFVEEFTNAGIELFRVDESTIAFEIDLDDEFTESTEISTSESIFGYDIENERIMQESAEFEKELDKLSALLENI